MQSWIIKYKIETVEIPTRSLIRIEQKRKRKKIATSWKQMISGSRCMSQSSSSSGSRYSGFYIPSMTSRFGRLRRSIMERQALMDTTY